MPGLPYFTNISIIHKHIIIEISNVKLTNISTPVQRRGRGKAGCGEGEAAELFCLNFL